MTKPVLLVVPFFLAVLSGCTNVAGGDSRLISSPEGGSLETGRLFSLATAFFSEAGYQCSADRDASRFRCSRELRDLYIHQTRAVVEIYAGEHDSYRLVPTRWDEGLIPGELISNTYANDDVEAFCTYLASEKMAFCRNDEG